MSRFQHTPAPWTARGNLETGLGVYAEGFEICQLFCIDGDAETEANGRLIAAAPLMFNELQRLVEQGRKEAAEAGEDETPWLDSARALLRQVAGEKS